MSNVKRGSCHCGAVEFEVELPDGIKGIRCNCSLCRRKGTVMMGVPQARLRVTKGADKLSLYQWNMKIAKHYFCSVCGIYTHHQRRMDPSQFGFNVACLDDVDPYALGDVEVLNGAALSVIGDNSAP
jgi:hypothetical protein